MNSPVNRVRRSLTTLLLLFPVLGISTLNAEDSHSLSASQAINQGNAAWVHGMETSDPLVIVETYAQRALDCGPAGDCDRGRDSILLSIKRRMKRLGHARSANVTSQGSSSQGPFVYEWGMATAKFANDKKIGGRYLTVWQKQENGVWKIIRNLAMP